MAERRPEFKNPLAAPPVPKTSEVYGFDVSVFRPFTQENIGKNPLKIGFVFNNAIKRTYLNPPYIGDGNFKFETYSGLSNEVKMQRDNGIRVGWYHRLIVTPDALKNPTNAAIKQADLFLNALNAAGGVKPGDFIASDLETHNEVDPKVVKEKLGGMVPPDMWQRLNPAQRLEFVTAFNNRVQEKTGIRPLIYTQKSFVDNYLNPASALPQVQLEKGQWVKTPTAAATAIQSQQFNDLGKSNVWGVNLYSSPNIGEPWKDPQKAVIFSQINFGEKTEKNSYTWKPPLVDGKQPQDQNTFNGNYGQLLNQSFKPEVLLFSKGMKGNDIAEFQRRFAKTGLINPVDKKPFYTESSVNGVFDAKMEAAVNRLKVQSNMIPDGKINQGTWNKMYGISQKQDQSQQRSLKTIPNKISL
jgi:Glycosyl hydrolases family 25